MISDRAIEKVLRNILRQFESGNTEQARQARERLGVLAQQLAALSPSRPVGKRRLSPLLRALWKARNANDRDAAFHIQSGLEEWLQEPWLGSKSWEKIGSKQSSGGCFAKDRNRKQKARRSGRAAVFSFWKQRGAECQHVRGNMSLDIFPHRTSGWGEMFGSQMVWRSPDC